MDLTEIGCEVRAGLIWLRIGKVGGSFKHSDGPSCSIKCEEFLSYLKQCLILQNGFVIEIRYEECTHRFVRKILNYPFKYEAQTALFKDPVLTAQ